MEIDPASDRSGSRPGAELKMHRYRAYGLKIQSEIPLPELNSDEGEQADVTIRIGAVPERLVDPHAEQLTWSARPGEWLQDIDGIGRYYVKDGREVWVEPYGGEDDVRSFLFSSTLGVLLHQRGLLTLHAGSVLMDGGAVAIAGPSTAGKSTTLAKLTQRGFPLLADDKTALEMKEDKLSVLSGYPTMRLWERALEYLELDPAGMPRLRGEMNKFLHRSALFHPDAVSPRAFFLLSKDSLVKQVEVRQLEANEAFETVMNKTYRKRCLEALGMLTRQFQVVSALCARVPVYELTRPDEGNTISEVVDQIVVTLES